MVRLANNFIYNYFLDLRAEKLEDEAAAKGSPCPEFPKVLN